MAKAKVNIPWLPMRVIVSRVARHLGCAVKYARLRIVQEAEAGSDQSVWLDCRRVANVAASRRLARGRLGRRR